MVGRVGQRVGHRLEEDEAAVLATLELDQTDAGRDARDPESVRFGRDDPGDVRAVAVVVGADRIEAAGDLAWPVDRRDIGVRSCATAPQSNWLARSGWLASIPEFDDPDEDPSIAGVDRTGEVGADHVRPH